MKLAEGGSLENALRGADGRPAPLPAAAARRVALGVARALAHLHRLPSPIAHNDLKAGNVLLDCAGNALLADFGIAKVLGGTLRNTARRAMEGMLGTAAYMAPENGDPEDAAYGKPQGDVYSYGMLLFELATGAPPWEGMNMAQINAAVVRGRRPQLPAGVDGELAALAAACWAQDPAARPSAAAVVARLVAMEWGRGGGERAAPGAAWAEKLRATREAAGADGAARPPPWESAGHPTPRPAFGR
jgi:serine/threonine protein kinase